MLPPCLCISSTPQLQHRFQHRLHCREPGPLSPVTSRGEGAEKRSCGLGVAHSMKQTTYGERISGKDRYGNKAVKCVF